MDLLTIDGKNLFAGNVAEQNEARMELLKSLQSTGFARLQNHGMSSEQVETAFAWAERFFNQTTAEKAEVANPDSPAPQRGWSRIGAERTAKLHSHGFGGGANRATADLTDAREHFDMSSSEDEYPNRWPQGKRMEGFEEFMEKFYRDCTNASNAILGAIEAATGLSEGTFASLTKHNASELRLNFYPEVSPETLSSGSVSRIWPHTDLGVITLLFQSSVSGLEIQDRSREDEFLPVPASGPAEIVLNISETMQRWSNDHLPAGVHRVTAPRSWPGKDDGLNVPRRYSIAYFTKADRLANVGSLPHFVGPDKTVRYDDMTAAEYHRQRLATAY